MKVPEHLAIIMDGNGRWAKARKHSRVFGHVRGMKILRETVKQCCALKIPHLSLFAFSAENWNRPEFEVKLLMKILKKFLIQEKKFLKEHDIQLSCIGETSKLPEDIQILLEDAISSTSSHQGLKLCLALSYGSQQEILAAAKRFAQKATSEGRDVESLNMDDFRSCLMSQFPDPDMIIRTSGESRLSNFLLFQAAYSEIYICELTWPEFTKEDLLTALDSYSKRDRRFGKLSETVLVSRENTSNSLGGLS